MILTQFQIIAFRNLDSLTFAPSPGVNAIIGPNGAGKSSVLEAIHTLSAGHSFRTRKARELVAHNADSFTVSGLLQDRQGREHRCGMRRSSSGEVELRMNYEPVRSMAVISRAIPVKALTPDSHALIQDGPTARRQFIDWGAFHEDSEFFAHWKLYRRALSQRNHALRSHAPTPEIVSWNNEFAAAGSWIDECRSNYLNQLQPYFEQLLGQLTSSFTVNLTYKRGFSEERTLLETLEKNLSQHQRFRTTTDGPHRAELMMTVGEHPARQVLSRGQQKLVVYALHLAQLEVLHQDADRHAIVLSDDLASELDQHNLKQVLTLLASKPTQVFIAGTESLENATNFQLNQGKITLLE